MITSRIRTAADCLARISGCAADMRLDTTDVVVTEQCLDRVEMWKRRPTACNTGLRSCVDILGRGCVRVTSLNRKSRGLRGEQLGECLLAGSDRTVMVLAPVVDPVVEPALTHT